MLKATAIVLGWAVLLCFTIITPSLSGDSLLTPIDSIPKLPESFELVDYKAVFTGGTLLPDRITVDSISLATGMLEAGIPKRLRDSIEVGEEPHQRTRKEQWEFVRGLLAQNNSSMHYYILADVYYNKQLDGWFKTRKWVLKGIGVLHIHLHAGKESGPYRAWLLRMILDPLPQQQVQYKQDPRLVLVRPGHPEVRWDINRNRVAITSSK